MRIRTPSDIEDDPGSADLLSRLPEYLYKYAGVAGERLDWLQRLLVESQMYFPSPRELNDPFDCGIPPRFDASGLVREGFWRAAAKRNRPDLKMRDLKKKIRRLTAESRTEAGRLRMVDDMRTRLNENGVACFAMSPTNTLLWSYYAEGHKGVAVRFEMSPEYLKRFRYECLPVEVKYERDFPNVNFFTSGTFELVHTILGTKAKAWIHEDEWRLVLVNKTGYVRVPPELIDGVILGMRIDPTVEANVREWLKLRKSPTVALLRVVNKPGSFELTITDAG